MSVTVKHYPKLNTLPESFVLLIHGDAEVAAFKQLVQRGSNCWDTAPASIKELADLVTTGQVMQNYTDLPKKG